METIEIKSMTSIEDAVKLVLHTAKLSGSRVVAEFNGFILDSKNSYDKNLDLYWACNVEGIPVTPEILNKNDFKEEAVGEYYTKPLDNEEYSLARYLAVERKSGNWAVYIKYCSLYDYALLRKIKYIHELQHILWALGLNA